jgi:thiamine-phosphate pyrophosphorylase
MTVCPMALELPRYYPILSTDKLGLPLIEAAGTMLECGVQLLQIRHKGPYTRANYEQAAAVAELCKQADARLIIDDRADIAAMLGAGVHVGQDDLPPDAIRRAFGPDMFLGFSTHSPEQILAVAGEPDYIALGPIFTTGSKENPDPVVGLENLKAWRPLWHGPLVAIGGITRVNAPDVIAAGANSVAVIGDAMPAEATPAALRKRTREWIEILK